MRHFEIAPGGHTPKHAHAHEHEHQPPEKGEDVPFQDLFPCNEEQFYAFMDAYGVYLVGAILLYLIYRSRGGLGFVKAGITAAVLASILWFFLYMGEVKRDQGELRLKYEASCVAAKHYDVSYCLNLLNQVRSMTTIGIVKAWTQSVFVIVPEVFAPLFIQAILVVITVCSFWLVKSILSPGLFQVPRRPRNTK